MQTKLTPRQQRFISEYLIDQNASAACVRAGYSPKGSNVTGSQLLAKPNIREKIQEKQNETAQRLQIEFETVLHQVREGIELARSNGDPGAMIRGCAELNKMMGFYQPAFSEQAKEDYASLSDAALHEIISD